MTVAGALRPPQLVLSITRPLFSRNAGNFGKRRLVHQQRFCRQYLPGHYLFGDTHASIIRLIHDVLFHAFRTEHYNLLQ